ncbi:hypothetical protein DEU56DRAFT_807276 [Suillus clintonianus]|uniref:uncharacterized protein n=1 Tax=Suillus clintonianus TaxID=1904413 RepID=UPI001B85E50A|nr:uncharacterized protein DEU56DRAFT_807276 [Suillus clintonianus]KAG2135486.1 hypothetical protein DEU56DRAFT_807276 [Suillus clintonianus]
MVTIIDTDNLPNPGSTLFLPSLLAHIRAAAPGLPLEPIIIQVLLLCIVSGDRNLILRTREEDIGLVSRLATISLTSVFGYITHKLRCHVDAKSQTPAKFLRSLFLPPPAAIATDGSISSPHRHHRSSTTVHSRKSSFPMSSSFSSDIARSIQRTSQLASDDLTAGTDGGPFTETRSMSTRLSLQTEPSVPNFGSSGNTTINARHASHVSPDVPKIPSAIVVSGLEHASLPAQRAVLRTLAEKKLVVADNHSDNEPELLLDLPDDFIMVYVCRLDPHERPPIYTSLLDWFAMSTPITVQLSTRTAMHHYQPHRSSTPSTALSSPSIPGYPFPNVIMSGPPTPPPPNSSTSVVPATFLARLKSLCATEVHMRPPLEIYLADLFTATRHFGALDAIMLTARARQDAEVLARAARLLGVDQTGAELIKEVAIGAPERIDEDSLTERGYPHSSTNTQSFEALIDGSALPYDIPEVTSLHTHRSMRSAPIEDEELLELDVSEADVARIFPRVVSHRVRVRDSPVDEILSSAVCGAVSRPGFMPKGLNSEDWEEGSTDVHDADTVWERETVKDILVYVLSKV